MEVSGRIRLKPESETVNFNVLKQILLSTDLAKDYQKLEALTVDDKCVFLDGSVDMTGNKVAF